MKKFKTSLLCVILAIFLTVSLLAVRQVKKSDDAFQSNTAYITAENLALNKGEDEFRKLTDGDTSTCFKSLRKSNTAIDIDLENTEQINCIVLKEDGLNIKDFTILASEDNENFKEIYHGDKVEYHRLCTFDEVNARYIRIFINESDTFFKLKEVEVYYQPKVNSNNFRMTGYVLSRDFSAILKNDEINDKHSAIKEMLKHLNFSELTHVNFHCGIYFDENGNIIIGDKGTDHQQEKIELKYMVECMREFGNSDLKITYVLPNWSNNPSTNIAMDNNREYFIKNLISFANEIGFDGIDFDYEFPQSDYDYQVFGDFLVELKNHMLTDMSVKENCILSCAFGTRDIHYPQKVIDAIDIVNMMTYDIFDQDGQHSSFWSCAVQGAEYLEKNGFSKEKINIGIPFYGTQVDALMEQYEYKDIKEFDYYKNNYIFNSYYDGSPTEVYFNSPAMVRDKTAYALLNEYGGIMVWHFSCDTDYSSDYSLWKAAYTAINQFGGTE